MYLGSTAVCCDEAMKLVTCLLILTFGYYCRKKEERGVYSQLSSTEGGGKQFTDEESEDGSESESNGAVAESNNESESDSFLSHLRKELQFDWRMVSCPIHDKYFNAMIISNFCKCHRIHLYSKGWSGITLHDTKEPALPSHI